MFFIIEYEIFEYFAPVRQTDNFVKLDFCGWVVQLKMTIFNGLCTHQLYTNANRNRMRFIHSFFFSLFTLSIVAGSLIYVFFGTVKEVSIGPTSLMALLTLQYTVDKPPEFAIILAFMAGCVELAMGILKLGEWHILFFFLSI